MMIHDHGAENDPAHLEGRLDRMLALGRITPEEAARVRSASSAEERSGALAAIRLRHAGERLAVGVEEGRLTGEEAHDALEQLAHGGDATDVRQLLGRRGHPDGN